MSEISRKAQVTRSYLGDFGLDSAWAIVCGTSSIQYPSERLVCSSIQPQDELFAAPLAQGAILLSPTTLEELAEVLATREVW